MVGSGWVSPPELVGNGGTSSKSSSIPSSFQLDDGGMLNDMGHFEEIGLGDDHEDQPAPPMKAPRGRLPTQRTVVTSALGALRDLTQKSRPAYPPLQTHSLHADHLGPPMMMSGPRRFTTPSAPSYKLSSRSSSPGLVSDPHSPNLSAVSLKLAATNVNGSHRQRISPTHLAKAAVLGAGVSWQTRRKTVEELEAECESDDDVPVDTIFYNVPISPRSSKALSATPSPERVCAIPDTEEIKPLPPPPLPPLAPRSRVRASTSSVPIPGEQTPESRGRTQFRAKSWNDAMDELGPEAKELSEALERHADEEMVEVEKRLQNGHGRVEQLPRPKSPPRTSIVELPPVQMTNGMIDPLPISKEKEAVLSRTRPSWLPPKSKEEEKRHLKEYQKMMRLSQEADRKRYEKERQEQEEKDRLKTDVHKVWDQHIIPNWNQMIRKPETRELWWRGVAPRCRGEVWKISFGNHLAVSADTFRLALKRAKDLEAKCNKSATMYTSKEADLFVSIRRDVDRTFPELGVFRRNGPLYNSLMDVLMAYTMYRSDVGYVYGTHVVAGLLLLNLSPDQSFITLANLLNRPLPLAFYTQDEGAMSRVYNLFLKAFKYKLPSLYQHIHISLSLSPSRYLEPMFLTLFALHCPIDITSRIWDVYSFEGDSFLVRTAIAVLASMESKLYGSKEEVLKILGWNAPGWERELGKDDEFMVAVRSAGKEEVSRGVVDLS